MSFKIGDQVQWTGYANGYSRHNVGTVVGIIQRRELLQDVLVTMPGALSPRKIDLSEYPKGYWRGDYRSYRPGESYLVKIGNRTRLYWPHASKLYAVLTPKLLDDAIAASSAAMGKECAKPLFDPFKAETPSSDDNPKWLELAHALLNNSKEFVLVGLRVQEGTQVVDVRVVGNWSEAGSRLMITEFLKAATR